MHDSVTVHMAAPPAMVWALVSDVTKIGRYSPETFDAKWVEPATGPVPVPGPDLTCSELRHRGLRIGFPGRDFDHKRVRKSRW